MFNQISDSPKYSISRHNRFINGVRTDYVVIRHEDGIHHEDLYMRMDTFDRMVAYVYGQETNTYSS